MINKISEKLYTASYYEINNKEGLRNSTIVDVRELVDGEGNDASLLLSKIDLVNSYIKEGKNVIICCDKGLSRSNAVALGVLISGDKRYNDVIKAISDKISLSEINTGLLNEIRNIFDKRVLETKREKRRIAITGSSGFLGSYLLPEIMNNHQIYCLNRDDLDLEKDVQLLDMFIKDNQIDCILHLAHPRIYNNVASLSSATAMIATILEACRINDIGVVYTSSLTVYSGLNSLSVHKVNSNCELLPKSIYGYTKYLCEELIRLYNRNYGLNYIILRPSGLYGKGMPESTFFSKFIESARQNKKIYTHRYSNGLPEFDFLDIRDLVKAVISVFDSRFDTSMTINIGSGKSTSTYDLAKKIVEISDSDSEVELININKQVVNVTVEPDDAFKLLGWKYETELDEGIRNMLIS